MIHKFQKRLTPEEFIKFKEYFKKGIANVTLDCDDKIDTKWRKCKEMIISSREKTRIKTTNAPRNAWITEKMWDAIKQRKELRCNADPDYTQYQRKFAYVVEIKTPISNRYIRILRNIPKIYTRRIYSGK